jgi:hypothetical protein
MLRPPGAIGCSRGLHASIWSRFVDQTVGIAIILLLVIVIVVVRRPMLSGNAAGTCDGRERLRSAEPVELGRRHVQLSQNLEE